MRGRDPGPPEPLSPEREASIRRDARGKLWSKHGGNERGYPTHRRALRDLLTEIDRLRAEVERLEKERDVHETAGRIVAQSLVDADHERDAARADADRLRKQVAELGGEPCA